MVAPPPNIRLPGGQTTVTSCSCGEPPAVCPCIRCQPLTPGAPGSPLSPFEPGAPISPLRPCCLLVASATASALFAVLNASLETFKADTDVVALPDESAIAVPTSAAGTVSIAMMSAGDPTIRPIEFIWSPLIPNYIPRLDPVS